MKYEVEFEKWLDSVVAQKRLTRCLEAWQAAIEFMESRTCEGCIHSHDDGEHRYLHCYCQENIQINFIVNKDFCCKYWEPRL